MWPTRPHGKGLPNSGVQDVRDTTGTEPRCNSTMVRPKQWVWQLLVQQRPIRQLQHSSSPTTTTSFASTTNRQSNTISPTCGNTGSSGSECPQGNDNNASSLTTKRIHRGRDHDRQRCSRTRLSNMVCTRHTTVSITIWTRSEAQDSNRWRHLSAWLQTGVHAQHQQANTGCSLLCVRRHTTKRNTNNHTQQGFNSALRQREGLYFLPVTLVTLPAKQTNNSKNSTGYTHTNRHGDPSKQQRSVDIQQPGFPGKSPQNTTQCTLHARQQMSSSNRKIGELQKDSYTTTKQQHRGHWRNISRPRQEATEESHPRTQLDRRNMVQSEKGDTPSRQHTTTTSTSTSQRDNTSNISTTYSRRTTSTNVSTQREEASHWGETNRSSNDLNTDTPNSNTISKRSQSNTGLLDQRRSILETCACPTKKGHVHSTTNRWWTRRDKADNMETNDGEANKWQPRIQNWRWLDDKEESNTRHRVDRLNKLWGEHSIERWVHHRWPRGATRSKREQQEHQHRNNQQNKNEENMNWHTFHTEAGVQHAYKAKADKTTTQNKQAKHQWSK